MNKTITMNMSFEVEACPCCGKHRHIFGQHFVTDPWPWLRARLIDEAVVFQGSLDGKTWVNLRGSGETMNE